MSRAVATSGATALRQGNRALTVSAPFSLRFYVIYTQVVGHAVHKEIFSFPRGRGRYKGKECEKIVKPVIEKWGGFVQAYV